MAAWKGSGPPGRPAMLARLAGPWWMFLLTGVSWLIISVVVLRCHVGVNAMCGGARQAMG
jgi:hypothetical protein